MNKLKFKKIYALLLGLLLLPTACNDDFLEKLPHSAIATERAFENLEDYEAAINGVYSAVKSGAYYGKNMMLMGDFLSDNLYARIGYSNSYGIVYQFEFTSGTGEMASLWSAGYVTAVRSTHIIDRIDQLEEGTWMERDIMKGEAHFARAMAHFDLLRYFSKPYQRSNPNLDFGVPYKDNVSLNAVNRPTISQTYERIFEDLEEAYTLLGAYDSLPTPAERKAPNHKFSQAVVDALYARIYFEMGRYEEAITHATRLIDDPSYTLLSGTAYENMWINDTGNEIILRMMITQSESTGATRIGSNFIGASSGILWSVDYLPALDLLQLYDDKEDIRFSTFYRRNTGTTGGTGIQTIIRKYPTNPAFSTRGVNMSKVFRLAEMYLIRAESYARTDRDGLALNDLNTLRAARINEYVDVDLSGEALFLAIKDERRMELAFEGHRYLDLKRDGEGFERVPQPGTLVANDLVVEADNFRFVWPIPEAEMLANPQFAGQQNDGY